MRSTGRVGAHTRKPPQINITATIAVVISRLRLNNPTVTTGVNASVSSVNAPMRCALHDTVVPVGSVGERIHRRMMSPTIVPGMTTANSTKRCAENSHSFGQSYHQLAIHPSPFAPRYIAIARARIARRGRRLSRVKYQISDPVSDANANPVMISSVRLNENVLP